MVKFRIGQSVKRKDNNQTGIVLKHYKTGTVRVTGVFPFNKDYLWFEANMEALA